MAVITIRDSLGLSSDQSDLVKLKLSPRQAYRLAMNLLQGCQSRVEAEGSADYTVMVEFAASATVYA